MNLKNKMKTCKVIKLLVYHHLIVDWIISRMTESKMNLNYLIVPKKILRITLDSNNSSLMLFFILSILKHFVNNFMALICYKKILNSKTIK